MSGPEYLTDPDDPRVEGRPLSPDVIAGHDHAQAPQDRPETGPDEDLEEEAEEARPSPGVRLRGFKVPSFAPVLAMVASYPRRRRDPADREARGEVEGEGPGGARPASRFSPRNLKPEARVGLAAALSFVLIVGVLVVKKGWLGGVKSPPASIRNPADGKKEDLAGQAAAGGTRPGGDAPRTPADPSPPGGLVVQASRPPEPQSPPSIDPDRIRPLQIAQNDPPAGEPTSTPPAGTTPPPAPAAEEKPLGLPGESADPLSMPNLPGPNPPAPAQPAPDPATAPAPAPAPAAPAEPRPADLPAMPTEPGPTLPAGSGLEPPVPGLPGMPEDKSGSPPVLPGPETSPEMTAGPDTSPSPAAPPASPAAPPAMPPPPAQPSPIEPPPEAMPEPARKPDPPRPPIKPPTLERVPAIGVDASPGHAPGPGPAPAGEGMGPGWVVVRSGGKKPLAAEASAALSAAPAPSRDGPPVREEANLADQVEPALHTVQPGENFWSISRLYYRSGRYYKALHAANRSQVPEIKELYVGQVLRIPPPEALDRALIDPPTPGRPAIADGPAVSRASRRSESSTDEVILARPIRPSIPREEIDAPAEPRRPTYRVKANETLRSIARDTLGDNRRYREILDLNRDAIEDPRSPLAPGMTLTLPEDAVIGRRAR